MEDAINVNDFLKKSKYYGKVGVYEGAGYATKGLYRAEVDCIMFTKKQERFCRVCSEAMVGIIEWYAK